MADAGDNYDDDEEVGEKSSSHFDPVQRTLDGSIQYYAQNQYFRQLQGVCDRALKTQPQNNLLLFWRAFALHKLGSHDEAIAILTPLAEEKDLALAAVALLLTAHNSRSGKDKKTLLELKSRLKVVSKQSTESSLHLAGRYFLYTGKTPKARQCIEKLIAKDKKNVDLLSLFGWIYLHSNEEKYIEKAQQVFKKSAKLSLPNFDIAALMGRARYFEQDGKIPKAIQALDSVVKIYPAFFPALEEKLRLYALTGKWKEVSKLKVDLAGKRSRELRMEDESLTMAYVDALEAFATESSASRHLGALKLLQDALAREENSSPYWTWQYVQLFSRLARTGPTVGPSGKQVWTMLLEMLQPAIDAGKAAKGGLSMNLLAVHARLLLLSSDANAATAAGEFDQVASAALTQEKAEKDDDDKAAGEEKPGKFNEDELLQKHQSYSYAVVARVRANDLAGAKSALEAIPDEAKTIPGGNAEEPPLPLAIYSYAQALVESKSGGSPQNVAARLLEACDAHLACMRDRAPADGAITTATANAVTGVNRYFVLFDANLLQWISDLALSTVVTPPISLDSSGRITALKSRPTPIDGAADTLTQLAAALRHATSSTILPGYYALVQSLTLLAWLISDPASPASTFLEKASSLEGEEDVKVIALGKAVELREGEQQGKQVVASPKRNSAIQSSASSSSAPAAPNTAQRRAVVRAALGEEAGIDFDDDEEDVDALFKGASEAAGEQQQPGGGNAGLSTSLSTTHDAAAELEAQAVLDALESKAGLSNARLEEERRMAEEARAARAFARKRAEADIQAQAEAEAAQALQKASKLDARAAEQRKQDEIAALRAAREAEKRRQIEEIERAEREREEQREAERAERLARQNSGSTSTRGGVAEITPIQAFNAGPEPLSSSSYQKPPHLQTNQKWNRPPEDSPTGSSPTPLSLTPGGSQYPAGSPLSVQPGGSYRPGVSPTAASQSSMYANNPAVSPTSTSAMTAQQLAHHRQVEAQRSDEARALAEKKEKIMQAGLQIEQAKKFTKVAFWGEVFLKHGRSGKPHERNVTLEVTGSELKFDWSSGQLKAHKNDIQLIEGKGTPVFQRPTAEKSKVERCFSIVTANRTLDLEAPNDQAREYWVNGIRLLLKYLSQSKKHAGTCGLKCARVGMNCSHILFRSFPLAE